MNPNCNGNRHDEVVLRTTYIKNVKLKIIKTTGYQNVGHFYYSNKPKFGRTKPWNGSNVASGCDIASLTIQYGVVAHTQVRNQLGRMGGEAPLNFFLPPWKIVLDIV